MRVCLPLPKLTPIKPTFQGLRTIVDRGLLLTGDELRTLALQATQRLDGRYPFQHRIEGLNPNNPGGSALFIKVALEPTSGEAGRQAQLSLHKWQLGEIDGFCYDADSGQIWFHGSNHLKGKRAMVYILPVEPG